MLAAAREVRTALGGETLAGLVNNAGIAVAGPLLGLSADEFRRQLDVNVMGPVIATQAFAPLLGADPALTGPRGRIVMISSVAGKNGNPLTPAYAASKHAIEGLSESLRREMMLFGIDVIIVAPGAVKTPIWGKADEVDVSRYQNSPYRPALEKVRQFTRHLSEIGLPPERDCRADCRGPDIEQAKGALRDHAGPDSAPGHGDPAEADGRQDHRQAPRAAAARLSSDKVTAMASVASA